MPTVEEELTDLLHRRAAAVPVDVSLLAAVTRRHSRAATKHRAELALAAAATVAAVSLVPTVMHRQPTPPRAESAVGAAVVRSSGFLVGAPPTAPSFPLTPSYLPAGVKRQARLSHQPGSSYASYESARGGRDGPLSGVDVAVLSVRPPAQPGLTPIAVTVQGRPAFLTLQPNMKYASVTWLPAPGRWVQVTGLNEWSTRAVVLAVANGLRERPWSASAEFRIAGAPAGSVLVEFHAGGITLGPRGSGPDSRDSVTVAARRPSSQTDGHGSPVKVGSRPGWLIKQRGRFDLVLQLSPAARLEVTTPAGGAWNEAELRRFAGGITYTGLTPRAEG